jgi:plastocyanin
MLDQLWSSILQFVNQLVSPDWGSLVALMPLAIVLLVVAFVVWLLIRWATVGPKRRGMRRLPPRPPAGVHAAEGSWAPIRAAAGAFVLFYGIIFGGWVLVLGITIFALALLLWLRESMREYDHVEHPVTALVPVTAVGPPPGVHVPGPSFRPITIALAAAALFYGLVFGGFMMAAGILMLAIALLQWLVDARREYRGVVIADTTGHAPADPHPNYPKATLAIFAIIFAGGIVLQTGVLPPKSSSASSGGAGASAAPGASGQPGASGGTGGGASAPAADVHITAQNIAYDQSPNNAAANKNFTIAFDNMDNGIPHNIDIQNATGGSIFRGAIVTGPITTIYQVPALNAGTYKFICDVHPTTMSGTLVVK